MMKYIFLALMLLIPVKAFGQSQAEKLCIVASVQKIPVIQNIKIENSRVEGNISPFTVEIDTSLAGKKITFVFVCATAEGKPAFASLAGIK